jgi:hypothetical protein
MMRSATLEGGQLLEAHRAGVKRMPRQILRVYEVALAFNRVAIDQCTEALTPVLALA